MKNVTVTLAGLILIALSSGIRKTTSCIQPDFGQSKKVKMIGYSGNIMEPFITRDGKFLLFNNLNAAPENTNLHWSERINDSTFQYKGEVSGVNTNQLEGVPSMDTFGNLYFVSDRKYEETLSTLYQCNFKNGMASHVRLVKGVSKLQPGVVNFDAEISADGQYLYFVDSQFDSKGNPVSADIVIAKKSGDGFKRLPNSDVLMKEVNTNGLEYGACISASGLALYFTRIKLPFTAETLPEIFVARRQKIYGAFTSPVKIRGITGFSEAPTIAPNQTTIYYHRKDGGKFVLYVIRKK